MGFKEKKSFYILTIYPNKEDLLPNECAKMLEAAAKLWTRPADLKSPGSNWGYSYDVTKILAFMKPIKQSSSACSIRDKRARPLPEIAIESVTEGDNNLEQVSLTDRGIDDDTRETCPWWQVDLLTSCAINEITLYFRTYKGVVKCKIRCENYRSNRSNNRVK